MASSKKDFEGWEFILPEDSSPTKRAIRRRGGGGPESMYVRRVSDGFELKPGDTILYNVESDESELAIIKEFTMTGSGYIDMIVYWFILSSDVQDKSVPLIENELLITAYSSLVYLNQVVEKVNVLSKSDFKSIVLDESNSTLTFLCQRGYDQDDEYFTGEIDFDELTTFIKTKPVEFTSYIRDLCSKKETEARTPGTNNKKKVVQKKVVKKKDTQKGETPTTQSKKKKIEEKEKNAGSNKNDDKKKEKEAEEKEDEKEGESDDENEDENEDEKEDENRDYDDDDNDDEGFVTASSGDDEPENDESEDDEVDLSEDEPVTKKSKPSPRKRKSTSRSTSPAKKTHLPSELLNKILSPHKKVINIKSNVSKPSLSSLSPKKSTGNGNKILGIDATSQAFRDIKSRLHASHRIASLPGREDEYASLFLSLDTAIQEETGCCIYVSGTPGVGKTATVREVIAQLQDSASAGELKKFDYLEINGLKLLSPNVAFEVLWEKISGFKVSSANAVRLLDQYFAEEAKDRKPLVVLMDELDQIASKKQNVMYNFFNWPTYSKSKLIVIAIANTMDLPERTLSNKISSRLGLNRIQFIGYTYEQLGDIIKHRLREIQRENKMKVIVKDDAISFASRKVASVSGDARRALTICRRAVEIAEQDFINKKKDNPNEDLEDTTCYVLISHISRAINETVNSPISSFIMSLPFAAKLVLGATLLRMKRSGLAENTLGDIIDEMKNSIQLFTSKDNQHQILQKFDTTLNDFLYGNGPLSSEKSTPNIRIYHFKHIINELAENGIITQQNILGERHRKIQLNVSEEEVTSVLRRDKEMNGFY
ncbi:origin recognition complex subunit 1 [Scheffersomyces amazonensis]|uniref:origin recognition complex subunit 1 n=1 Tax=Scheffersomyces amazonensis TaxID=1078765 RepID=UPI00315CEAFE